MLLRDNNRDHTPPAKVAEKDVRCYECGGIISKGSRYYRKDLVRAHYQQCPTNQHHEPN